MKSVVSAGIVALLILFQFHYVFSSPKQFAHSALQAELVRIVQDVQSSVVPVHAQFQFGNIPSIDLTNLANGIVVQPNIVIASAAVVKGSTRILVAHSQEEAIDGRIVGWDDDHDLAIIALSHPLKTTPVILSENENPVPGEPVLILTNSMSVAPIVSIGIVSGIRKDGIIQISGSLPFGAEGGAVFDLSSRLIGLVFDQFSSTLALGENSPARSETVLVHPILQIFSAVGTELHNANLPNVYMGISVVDWLSQLGGAHIQQVMAQSPAALSGLQVGDIILSANKHKVSKAQDLYHNVRSCSAGTVLDLRILRSHQIMSVAVLLDSLPKPSAASLSSTAQSAEPAEALSREFIETRIKSLEKEINKLRRLLK